LAIYLAERFGFARAGLQQMDIRQMRTYIYLCNRY